jgi:hypothetical protein
MGGTAGRDTLSVIARQLDLTARGVYGAMSRVVRQQMRTPHSDAVLRVMEARRKLLEVMDMLGNVLGVDELPAGAGPFLLRTTEAGEMRVVTFAAFGADQNARTIDDSLDGVPDASRTGQPDVRRLVAVAGSADPDLPQPAAGIFAGVQQPVGLLLRERGHRVGPAQRDDLGIGDGSVGHAPPVRTCVRYRKRYGRGESSRG